MRLPKRPLIAIIARPDTFARADGVLAVDEPEREKALRRVREGALRISKHRELMAELRAPRTSPR